MLVKPLLVTFCHSEAIEIISCDVAQDMQKLWMLTPFHVATQEREKSTDVRKMLEYCLLLCILTLKT